MAKVKTVYVCTECGSEHAKWQGQCNDCGEWNTLKSFNTGPVSRPRAGTGSGYAGQHEPPKPLAEVDARSVPRIDTGSTELDRVLGGGLVPGSVAVACHGFPVCGFPVARFAAPSHWLPVASRFRYEFSLATG